MSRPYYFGSGPAHLPEEVLSELQKNWLNWESTGVSILEIGHRTAVFQRRMDSLEQLIRDLLVIPESYHVLLMGFPMRVHFDLIPRHLIHAGTSAAYLVSGYWSEMALKQAQAVSSQAYAMATSPSGPMKTTPSSECWERRSPCAYVYYTPNETLDGIWYDPDLSSLQSPVIADMTSCLFSRRLDIQRYACVIAGSQKNFGTAGLGLMLVHQDVLNAIEEPSLGTYLDYRTYANQHSMCVTPPIFNCEVTYQMLQWMNRRGGVAYFEDENKKKAQKLYDYLDASLFYQPRVAPEARSQVTATFHLRNAQLEPTFFQEAQKHGLLGLEGHRVIGGVRVGMYNAVSMQAIEQLVDFLHHFAERYRTAPSCKE
jgi:phosphoserine aminotransferase